MKEREREKEGEGQYSTGSKGKRSRRGNVGTESIPNYLSNKVNHLRWKRTRERGRGGRERESAAEKELTNEGGVVCVWELE